jgi:hypothetical protein
MEPSNHLYRLLEQRLDMLEELKQIRIAHIATAGRNFANLHRRTIEEALADKQAAFEKLLDEIEAEKVILYRN